jgi:SAM-dependent methyltransferase
MSRPQSYLNTVYDEERTPRTSYPAKLAAHLARLLDLKPGMSLLDVGCGRGEMLESFISLGLKAEGADREQATQDLPISLCDLENASLPFADGQFDVVFSKSVLEHFHDPMPFMDEALRVLRPGGLLVIMTPDWKTCYKVFYEDITHRRPFDVVALGDMLLMCELQDIRVKRFIQWPSAWTSFFVRLISGGLRLIISADTGRWLARKTGLNYLRWSVELMLLGIARKPDRTGTSRGQSDG